MNRKSITQLAECLMLLISVLWSDATVHGASAQLPALNCSAPYQIDQSLAGGAGSAPSFKNGSAWSLCFTPVKGYGFVVSDLRYKSQSGSTLRIIESMHIAQMFVPYDNNAARYHDITYGVQLAALTSSDCPSPGLVSSDGTLCITVEPRGSASTSATSGLSTQGGERLRIFGYYGIGAYYYTFQVLLNDDGSIEPMLGASGSLQWTSTDSTTGWPITATSKNKNWIGVNHNHLAMWRIHFAIDDGNQSPVTTSVSQIDTNPGTDPGVAPLTSEVSIANNLPANSFWKVTGARSGTAPLASYEIEPSVDSQYRASTENFTWYDFYLTQYKSAEVLVDGGLLTASATSPAYVNNETVTDPVIWYGINFHHVPREEDNTRMPQHWQGFVIRPLQ